MSKTGQKVTLKDIAKETGYSLATVSRVLGNGDRFFSEETEKIILEAAQRLHYRPNLLARGLKTGNTYSIAFLVPQLDEYYNNVYLGIHNYMSKQGYSVSTLSSDYNQIQEDVNIQHIIERQYDGVIVATGFLSKERNLHPKKVFGDTPLVMTEYEDRGDKILSVSLNVREAAVQVTEHLIGMGHRKIAYLSAPDRFDTLSERYKGYRLALSRHGIELDSSIVFFDEALERTNYDEMYRLMKRVLSHREFTALISMSDYAAIAALRVASDMGLKIPEDLSIIGFDDVPYTQYTMPPLTTVSQKSYIAGQESAKILMGLLQGVPVKNTRLDCELVVRGSSGPCRQFR